MPSQGYAQFPAIHQDRIVFVAEDDLWLISSEGGRAERLTAGVGRASYPRFSHDGQLLAFTGREEGPGEVYVMPALGGTAQRLTFQADSQCRILGWTPANDAILYTSSAGQFTYGYQVIYTISPQGGLPQKLPFGMANAISYGPNGGIVLGRNIDEPAHWKRYRGGSVGHLWCDAEGKGTFQRLLRLQGNLADPCWIGERIYFLSDHEGVGNLYSCTPQGEDLHRHTNQSDFYARHLSTDGRRLVFQAGAELYLFDPATNETSYLDVQLPSQRTQLNRKFVSASVYLDTVALHPEGHSVALTTRGKAFSMGNWEGAVIQHGERDGVRYRFLEWLNDGKRLVAISDAIGREALIVFDPTEQEPQTLTEIEFGRAVELCVSPTDDVVALTNHRNELIIADLVNKSATVLDRSNHERIRDLAWSPDGRWIAYSFALTTHQRAIKLGNLENNETHFATDPVLEDVSPAFDPDGKYLYFLGYRIFSPVADNLQFDMGFPRGVMPYVITLQRDVRSPFILESKLLERKKKVEDNEEQSGNQQEETEHPPKLVIDLEGITSRVIPFPVTEGRYNTILGIKGKVLFLTFPVPGDVASSGGWLECYDLETLRLERSFENVSSINLSRDYKTLMYRTRNRLRIVKAGEKASKVENNDHPSRESGWLNLHRVKVSVQPVAEWKQMFAEAWRLQREQFWTEDMSGIDWDAIYAQYAPLVERVGSRAELSDLIHELQGELGTSHAYESGGEYRHERYYSQGFLGVDWTYDAESQCYRIAHIVQGDPSSKGTTSPLTIPGLNIAVGDAVLAINGQRVQPASTPQELLVNHAGNEVHLTIESAETKEVRVIAVTTLYEERTARYRDWVANNRRTVHELSQGRVGYIHIPDMQVRGFAEFHRSYLTEYDYPALIVDVRWNGGGRVSSLLLEKLARRRIGYKFPRWGQATPYPRESPRGPMVALTNEHAGSDGDIFCHSFKLMGLGPLIGKRTWGGVIGIAPQHRLVDGTRTTQPEYASWFKDVEWEVENYGTDPDIEVDIAPQDYIDGHDPQLARAITEVLRLADEYPVLEPITGDRPRKGR